MPIVFFLMLGLLLPATPRASKSLLFANQKKDELLQRVKSPRMIFVGGSNLSFGLNSQIIKNELNINPINTAVHAAIGVRYMFCLLYTSPSPRDLSTSRMPSSA